MRETCDDLRDKATAKGLALNVSAPAQVKVLVNEDQFMQVVLNLVENAIKYTNQGEVSVTLSEHDSRAVLVVTDTGIGIPVEHQPRVFERFYRVDKGRSRATGGTGLGLSIVKHIVESHDGNVELRSELNKGTEVTVSMPLYSGQI